MATTEVILPDLQSCVLCEDVRHEFNGMQTLVGVINIVPAPQLPITCMRLCIWSRWCSGAGKFKQRSRIIGVDEQQVLAQAEVEFELTNGDDRSYPARLAKLRPLRGRAARV